MLIFFLKITCHISKNIISHVILIHYEVLNKNAVISANN